MSEMTWEQLCEKAKEMDYVVGKCTNFIRIDLDFGESLVINKNGHITISKTSEYSIVDIAFHRTIDQMYNIMLAMKD